MIVGPLVLREGCSRVGKSQEVHPGVSRTGGAPPGINASAWACGRGVARVGGPHHAIHGCASSLSTLRACTAASKTLLPTVDRRWLSTSADVRRARPRPATIARTVIANGSTGA
jgi:hypothetical protein